MTEAVAHQRKRREEFALADGRAPSGSLVGYSIEIVSKRKAEPLILKYEWLGDIGRATLFAGLLSPSRELMGVACFGYGPGPGFWIRRMIGEPALCLERGACVHYAPANAASYLIARACKLAARLTEVERFFAYCDPEAGEYGAVYQACNWAYLGQGLHGRNKNGERKHRRTRTMVLQPGRDPNKIQNWQTTRALRDHNPPLRYKQAESLGWIIKRENDSDAHQAKHVYAVHVGLSHAKPRKAIDYDKWLEGKSDYQRWLETIGALPYPAPRPELKRKPRS